MFGRVVVSPASPRRSDLYERPSYLGIIGRVAANVRRMRQAREWTQMEAATACEMVPYQYQRVEAGKFNVTATTLSRLCDGFNVDVSELFEQATPSARRTTARPARPTKTESA